MNPPVIFTCISLIASKPGRFRNLDFNFEKYILMSFAHFFLSCDVYFAVFWVSGDSCKSWIIVLYLCVNAISHSVDSIHALLTIPFHGRNILAWCCPNKKKIIAMLHVAFLRSICLCFQCLPSSNSTLCGYRFRSWSI